MTNAKTPTKPMAEVTNAKAAGAKSAGAKAAGAKPVVTQAVGAKAAPLKPAPAKPKAKAKPAAPSKTVAAQEAAKVKHKLVRDSFTIPKSEYAVLDALKQRAVALARPAKKSEVLRAGIAALAGMADKAFLAALDSVPALKTGRPKGH